MTGPKGDKGDPGPQGPQGPEGPAGPGGVWGSITGDLSSQADLMSKFSEYAKLSGSYNVFQNANYFGSWTYLQDNVTLGIQSKSVYLQGDTFVISPSNQINARTLSGNTLISHLIDWPRESGTLALTKDIPSLSGYATEAYVSSAIGELSSIYASISALSGYATESFVSSAISALDYASVGALSADTVIPDLTGYATESWVSSNFLSIGAVPSLSGYAELSAPNTFTSINSYIGSTNGNARLEFVDD